jgi:tetratricopeptide (TPR) repeat protein
MYNPRTYMKPSTRTCSGIFLSLLLFSNLLTPASALGQDLVATESLGGGSSVFVFRESRKKPLARSGGGRVASSAVRRANAQQVNSRMILAASIKRRQAAVVARKQAAVAAANRKIALSNTLTAKAEGFLDGGQTDLAITNYRDALVQFPKNARASDGLSIALTSKGIDVAGETNNEAAIQYFDEAVKLDGKNDVAV